jgi:hypothetical protein
MRIFAWDAAGVLDQPNEKALIAELAAMNGDLNEGGLDAGSWAYHFA